MSTNPQRLRMKSYTVKMTGIICVKICTDNEMSETDLIELYKKYGTNSIFSEGSISRSRIDKILSYDEVCRDKRS